MDVLRVGGHVVGRVELPDDGEDPSGELDALPRDQVVAPADAGCGVDDVVDDDGPLPVRDALEAVPESVLLGLLPDGEGVDLDPLQAGDEGDADHEGYGAGLEAAYLEVRVADLLPAPVEEHTGDVQHEVRVEQAGPHVEHPGVPGAAPARQVDAPQEALLLDLAPHPLPRGLVVHAV